MSNNVTRDTREIRSAGVEPPAVGTLWISRTQGRALPLPLLVTRVTEDHVFYRKLGRGHSQKRLRWANAFEPLDVAELADFILG